MTKSQAYKYIFKKLKQNNININSIREQDLRKALIHDFQFAYGYYAPHKKQKIFHNLGKSAKVRLFLAGNRVGKTLCACAEVAMHTTGIYPKWWEGYQYSNPVEALVVGVTAQTTRDVLQQEKYIGRAGINLGLIPEHLVLKKTMIGGIAGAVDTLTIQHISGGYSTLSFRSSDQGSAKFQGLSKDIIHFDEEMPLDLFTEALTRLVYFKKKAKSMMLITMTPMRGMTLFLESFLKDKKEGIVNNNMVYLQASWSDNPYLSTKQQDEMIKNLPEHETKARIMGIPHLESGLVYPVNLDKVFIEPIKLANNSSLVFSMDFGWKNPTAVLFAALDIHSENIYVYKEYYVVEKTPFEHSQTLIKFGCNVMNGVCDPSGFYSSQHDGRNFIELYREAGIPFLYKANNLKEFGIMNVLQKLKNGSLKIFNNCNQLKAEMLLYHRDKNGAPIKKHDHLMDCLRYIVLSGKIYANNYETLVKSINVGLDIS